MQRTAAWFQDTANIILAEPDPETQVILAERAAGGINTRNFETLRRVILAQSNRTYSYFDQKLWTREKSRIHLRCG